MTPRLIEEWLPIAELSEECVRERRSMTALPPTYYLHVWWARRPLVACRAAILASLLPPGADRKKFMHLLGIHGDPVAAKKRIAKATREGVRLGKEAYGYPRAFSYTPTEADREWLRKQLPTAAPPCIADSTAGGGSISFEALRLGFKAIANDLNPVAWLVLKATVEFPARYGPALLRRFDELGRLFRDRAVEQMKPFYPPEPGENCVCDGYLWARTVTCPYCGGKAPLSPNWRLDSKGQGVRLIPVTDKPKHRHIRFEIVDTAKEHSPGTVSGGNGSCPFPDCGRVINGGEIKAQAQAGKMGEQLYCVVYREHKVVGHTKAGKPKIKKIRGFRAPRPEDGVSAQVQAALDGKLPEWQARGIVPDEEFPANTNDDRPRQYGMPLWRDMFSPRQLLGHCVSVEVFQDIMAECGGPADVGELDRAALAYIALALDKLLNYNARMVRWHANREVVAGVFDRHDFSFKWSYAEMAPTITGLGYDWAIKQTGKALRELIELAGWRLPGKRAKDEDLLPTPPEAQPRDVPVTITCGSGDDLPGVAEASVDAVVLDPPYEANLMYAELADFFYVWLKRTAGLLFPEPFSGYLTDKDREAVANVAKFKDFGKVKGSGGARQRSIRDYQERMRDIFAECRRVLKPGGIMTLMFTHKATRAWDALAKGLVNAGFVISASWPIKTEAEGSLHIKDKNAAKSTIFLVCRPRKAPVEGAGEAEKTYWEDVEPKVAEVVRKRVAEFQAQGIGGVDLYLACFGPALQVFSEYWPMIRGRAVQKPPPARGTQRELFEEDEWDPYAVHPEDALMAARTAVKEWRLEQLTKVKRRAHLDPVTEFFVLAWDAFQAASFPADEALKLARVVGVGFDKQLRNQILGVKGNDVTLWDSALRAQKGSLGAPSGQVLLDALHQAARAGREQNIGVARDLIVRAKLTGDPNFQEGLEAVLNVLPTPRMVLGKAPGPVAGAAADAGALEKLRQLMYPREIPQPERWLFDMEGEGEEG